MEAQGLTYPVMILISVLSSLFYGPFINAPFALGEETGWRGFLFPQLKARFGRRKGRLLGGFIWGAWHWPLIWLIGYEYGAAAGNQSGYFGFPFSGMLLFSVITIGWGRNRRFAADDLHSRYRLRKTPRTRTRRHTRRTAVFGGCRCFAVA